VPSSRVIPDAEFAPAPIGTRIRLLTIFTPCAIVIGTMVTSAITAKPGSNLRWWPLVAPLILLPIIGGAWCGARIRRYLLAGDELLVERAWLKARFTLKKLQAAVPDRDALRGARRIVGNDGLGAISGRFRSKRLGRFRAYVTDPEQAVVLRWPDRCLVISPQHPSLFVETVRKRAGLSA